MLAASRPRSTVDRASTGISMLGISTHPLVVALLLQLFLASKWHWLPQTGYCDFIPKGAGDELRELRPAGRVQRPGRLGGAPRDPVDRLRRLLRRALLADDPRADARGARPGLRPHRPREGSPAAARPVQARAPEHRAPDRDHAGDGHRHRGRDLRLHRGGLPDAGARADDAPVDGRPRARPADADRDHALHRDDDHRPQLARRPVRGDHRPADQPEPARRPAGGARRPREDPPRLADVPGAGRPRPRRLRRAARARARRAAGTRSSARSSTGAPAASCATSGSRATPARRRSGSSPTSSTRTSSSRPGSRPRSPRRRRSSSPRTARTSPTSAASPAPRRRRATSSGARRR